MCCIAAIPAVGPVVAGLSFASVEEARKMVEQMAQSDAWKKMDDIDREIEVNPGAFFELPTEHTFYPGLYRREVLMTEGRWISTRVHLTDHPFTVLAGHLLCFDAENGVTEIIAPYEGSTKAGTRRLIYILKDTHWITYHANPDNETDPDKIVARLTYNNRELRDKVEALT